MYRVGWLGWKLAARMGASVLVRVLVLHDEQANVYWATSPDLDGLVVSAATLDELKSEAISACEELLSLQFEKPPAATARFTYQETTLAPA